MSRDRRLTVTNTDDPEQVAKAQSLGADRDGDLLVVLQNPRSRRWLASLIFETAHTMARSYVPGERSLVEFNEGARSVGLAVWEQVMANHPEFASKLLEEQIDG